MTCEDINFPPNCRKFECSRPVEAGFVTKEKDWLYSSATDYNGCKGLLEIIQMEPLII